jgi:hypothetical protein
MKINDIWNQSAQIDTIPNIEDFKKTISDYFSWEFSVVLKNSNNVGK